VFSLLRYVEKTSTFIQNELDLSEERRKVIAYGMEAFMSTLLGLLGIILFGYLFGFLGQALVISLTAAVVKLYIGGPHYSTMLRCNIYTITVFMTLTYISINFLYPSLALITGGLIISIMLIARYAPAEVQQKPLSDSHKKALRKSAFKLSILLALSVGLIYFFFNEYFALYLVIGFLWATLMMTPAGFTMTTYTDNLFKLFEDGILKFLKRG